MSDPVAGSPPAAPPSTSFSFSDLLDKDVAVALEAVAAEGKSVDAIETPPEPVTEQVTVQGADTVPAAPAAPPAPPAPPQRSGPPETVPYSRFAEVYGEAKGASVKLTEAEKRIANLEGQLAQVQRAPVQAPAPPPPNPVQLIDHRRRQIQGHLLDLDRRYAKGDLTVQEHLEGTRALQAEREALTDRRSEIVSSSAAQQVARSVPPPAAPPAPQAPVVRGSLAVKQAITQIENAEPWSRNVPHDILGAPSVQAQVVEMGRAIAASTGKPLPIDPNTEEGIVNRTALTVLVAKEMGLDKAYGGVAAPVPAAPPPNAPGQSPSIPAPPKMNQPPAIGAMGVGAPAPIPGNYTAEQIARMPMEDVMKLPADVLNHLAPER
jgi:hypothetical protein